MFVHMSVHTPRDGTTADLVASMHRFAAAAAGAPGLIGVHTLRDELSGRLVGLAMWESRDAWAAGVEAMRDAVAADPFDEWEQVEPDGFRLVEV
jgi:heme-degrading monooxygenase HmoA